MAVTTTNSGRITLAHRTVAIISFVLSAYFNVRFLVGRHYHLDPGHPDYVRYTPFTANIFFVLGYWGALHLLQAVFLTQFYKPQSGLVTTETSDLGWHFSLFNLLHAAWSLLFARGHYFLSEAVLVVNFINLLATYVSHRPYATRPLGNWIIIHLTTAAMPLAWIFFAIFWNGAVLFHAKGLASRIVANVLIWDFLLVPAMFLLLYRDWGMGLASSYLMAALGAGQFLTKVVALQWIFAWTISGLLFVGSLFVAVTGVPETAPAAPQRDAERAPLLG